MPRRAWLVTCSRNSRTISRLTASLPPQVTVQTFTAFYIGEDVAGTTWKIDVSKSESYIRPRDIYKRIDEPLSEREDEIWNSNVASNLREYPEEGLTNISKAQNARAICRNNTKDRKHPRGDNQ